MSYEEFEHGNSALFNGSLSIGSLIIKNYNLWWKQYFKVKSNIKWIAKWLDLQYKWWVYRNFVLIDMGPKHFTCKVQDKLRPLLTPPSNYPNSSEIEFTRTPFLIPPRKYIQRSVIDYSHMSFLCWRCCNTATGLDGINIFHLQCLIHLWWLRWITVDPSVMI